MSGEREYVETIRVDVEAAFAGEGVVVATGLRLPYALNVMSYCAAPNTLDTSRSKPEPHGYQTDLLVADQVSDGWAPRVVVEFKLGSVTTHDALTYSAKAATHKNIHPYLRYGIVVGNFDGHIPKRLIRHGQSFDFMMTLASETLSLEDRSRLISLLKLELSAARELSRLVLEKSNFRTLHRALVLS